MKILFPPILVFLALLQVARAIEDEETDQEFLSACETGDIRIVDLILSGFRTNYYYEGARVAAKNGHLEIIKLLVKKHSCSFDILYNEISFHACESDHLDIINFVISQDNYNQKDDGCHVMRWACGKGDLGLYRTMLGLPGADPTAFKNECIRLAVGNGHVKVVKELLLERRINPFARKSAALHDAIKKDRVDIVKLLVSDHRLNYARRHKLIDNASEEIRDICKLAFACLHDDLTAFHKLKYLFDRLGPRFYDDITANLAGPNVRSILESIKYNFVQNHIPGGVFRDEGGYYKSLHGLGFRSRQIIKICRHLAVFNTISTSFWLPDELKLRLALIMAGLENTNFMQ